MGPWCGCDDPFSRQIPLATFQPGLAASASETRARDSHSGCGAGSRAERSVQEQSGPSVREGCGAWPAYSYIDLALYPTLPWIGTATLPSRLRGALQPRTAHRCSNPPAGPTRPTRPRGATLGVSQMAAQAITGGALKSLIASDGSRLHIVSFSRTTYDTEPPSLRLGPTPSRQNLRLIPASAQSKRGSGREARSGRQALRAYAPPQPDSSPTAIGPGPSRGSGQMCGSGRWRRPHSPLARPWLYDRLRDSSWSYKRPFTTAVGTTKDHSAQSVNHLRLRSCWLLPRWGGWENITRGQRWGCLRLSSTSVRTRGSLTSTPPWRRPSPQSA